jgi:hypothetical protein
MENNKKIEIGLISAATLIGGYAGIFIRKKKNKESYGVTTSIFIYSAPLIFTALYIYLSVKNEQEKEPKVIL